MTQSAWGIDHGTVEKSYASATRKLTNAAGVGGGAVGALAGGAAGGLAGDSRETTAAGMILGGAAGAAGARGLTGSKLKAVKNPFKRAGVKGLARKVPEFSVAGAFKKNDESIDKAMPFGAAGPLPRTGDTLNRGLRAVRDGSAASRLSGAAGKVDSFVGRGANQSRGAAWGGFVRDFRSGMAGKPKLSLSEQWTQNLSNRARDGFEARQRRFGGAAPKPASRRPAAARAFHMGQAGQS